MKYTDEHLNEAVKNNIFTDEQIGRFREYVRNNTDQVTKFQKTLYYGGGLLIISAMTWLMRTSWTAFGTVGITVISASYILAFFIAGYYVFFRKKLEIAGDCCFPFPSP